MKVAAMSELNIPLASVKSLVADLWWEWEECTEE